MIFLYSSQIKLFIFVSLLGLGGSLAASPLDSVLTLKVAFGEDDTRHCTGVKLSPRGYKFAHHWALIPKGCSIKGDEGSAFEKSNWCSDKVTLQKGFGRWEKACEGSADLIEELGEGDSGFVLLPVGGASTKGAVPLGAFTPDFSKTLVEGLLVERGLSPSVSSCRFSRDTKSCKDRRTSWSPIFDPEAKGALIAFVSKEGQTINLDEYADSLKDRVMISDSKGSLIQPFGRSDLQKVGGLNIYLESQLDQDGAPVNTLFFGIVGQEITKDRIEVYHKGIRRDLVEAAIKGFSGSAFELDTEDLRSGARIGIHWYDTVEGSLRPGHQYLLIKETDEGKDQVVSAKGGD